MNLSFSMFTSIWMGNLDQNICVIKTRHFQFTHERGLTKINIIMSLLQCVVLEVKNYIYSTVFIFI